MHDEGRTNMSALNQVHVSMALLGRTITDFWDIDDERADQGERQLVSTSKLYEKQQGAVNQRALKLA
jgi:hypothetical protein